MSSQGQLFDIHYDTSLSLEEKMNYIQGRIDSFIEKHKLGSVRVFFVDDHYNDGIVTVRLVKE